MLLAEVQYARPSTLDDAVRLLGEHDGARALAGGQTLTNVMKARAAAPDVLVDLNDLSELRTVSSAGDGLELGAMLTLTELIRSSEVAAGASDPRRGRVADRRRPGAKPRARSAGTSARTTRRTICRRSWPPSARR